MNMSQMHITLESDEDGTISTDSLNKLRQKVADSKKAKDETVSRQRAALESEIEDDGYTFDKFDRFFSAFDFFQEPTTVINKDREKTRHGKRDGSEQKIPLRCYTIARSEKKKSSYLEMYKKKCSKKLKKVMKDTVHAKTELEGTLSPASDQCSISSEVSVGNASDVREEKLGKGDGLDISDEEQHYYDAIQKYERGSDSGNKGSVAKSKIPSEIKATNVKNGRTLNKFRVKNQPSNLSNVESCNSNVNTVTSVPNTRNPSCHENIKVPSSHRYTSNNTSVHSNHLVNENNPKVKTFLKENNPSCHGNIDNNPSGHSNQFLKEKNTSCHSNNSNNPSHHSNQISKENNPSCHGNTRVTHDNINNNPSLHSNRISKENNSSCHGNASTNRIKVSDMIKNINKVNEEKNTPEKDSNQDLTLIYMKDSKGYGTDSNSQKAHSVQNISTPRLAPPQSSFPDQKSMSIVETVRRQRLTPANQAAIIDEQMETADKRVQKTSSVESRVQKTSSVESPNSMASFPSSIQSMAKVYPLSKVYPGRTESASVSVRPTEDSESASLSVRPTEDLGSASTSSILNIDSMESISTELTSRLDHSKEKIQLAGNVSSAVFQKSTTSRTGFTKKQEGKKSTVSIPSRNRLDRDHAVRKKSVMAYVQTQEVRQDSKTHAVKASSRQEIGKLDQKSKHDKIESASQQLRMQQKSQQESASQQLKMQQKSQQNITQQQQKCQKDVLKSRTKISKAQQKSVQEIPKLLPKISERELLKAHQTPQLEVLKPFESSSQKTWKPQNKPKAQPLESAKVGSSDIAKLVQSKQEIPSSKEQAVPLNDENIQLTTIAEQKLETPNADCKDPAEPIHVLAAQKTTQSEEMFRSSDVETIRPSSQLKRPATTSDASRSGTLEYRHLSGTSSLYSRRLSKQRKSYVELYQQKRLARGIPVPIAKPKAKQVEKMKKVPESVQSKKWGGVGTKERTGKTPHKKDDVSKAGGESTKSGIIKPLRRYNLKKKAPSQDKIDTPNTELFQSIEDEQDDLQLKRLEQKKEQLQKQLKTIKSKPRSAFLDE